MRASGLFVQTTYPDVHFSKKCIDSTCFFHPRVLAYSMAWNAVATWRAARAPDPMLSWLTELTQPQSKSVFFGSDFIWFRRQEVTFIVLNLFILATLVLVHTLFAWYWGFPSIMLITIPAGAVVAYGGELFWLDSRIEPLGLRGMAFLSWGAICFNILLAVLLGSITNREDTQCFVIMIVPILVAAFRLTLGPTLAVVTAIDCINLFWVWQFARQ